MDEAAAISALKDGDIGALEWLVREHQTKALRAAYLIVRNTETAEDVVQSAFIRAFRSIQSFDSARPFAPWFMKIVANDAIKALKSFSEEYAFDVLPSTDGRQGSPSQIPETALEQLQTREEIWALLKELSPQQRAAVVLRYYAGLSSKDIAEDLGISEGTVRWRVHAALKRLRGLVARSSDSELRDRKVRRFP